MEKKIYLYFSPYRFTYCKLYIAFLKQKSESSLLIITKKFKTAMNWIPILTHLSVLLYGLNHSSLNIRPSLSFKIATKASIFFFFFKSETFLWKYMLLLIWNDIQSSWNFAPYTFGNRISGYIEKRPLPKSRMQSTGWNNQCIKSMMSK